MKILELINSNNITGIIAIIAIISPVFVAIINGIIQIIIRKIDSKEEIGIKQIDVYYSDKKAAFHKFIDSAGKYGATFKHTVTPSLAEFEANVHNVLLYCEKKNKKTISDFWIYSISLRQYEPDKEKIIEYSNRLSEISSILNDELFELRQRLNKS